MRRAILALALALAGCEPARGFIASPADYAAYRETRVAPTFEGRLAAAHHYLTEYPEGQYRAEVRAFFDPAEEAFYAANKATKVGLVSYLDTLPRGPHRDQAVRRIGEMETAERTARAELARSAAEVEARVSGRAAVERTRVRATLNEWVRRFLDRAAFSVPLSAAPADLVVPMALSLPSPRCTLLDAPEGRVARRCVKLFELPYTVQVDRGTEAREATMEVVLAQDARGVPVSATIAGPDLFLRLEETFRVKPLLADDPAHRVAGISRAVDLVKAAFLDRVSEDAACRRAPAPPAVLDLACGGVRVTVTAGAGPGDDDRVVIAPQP